jgi:hypothetical protein
MPPFDGYGFWGRLAVDAENKHLYAIDKRGKQLENSQVLLTHMK